MLPTLELVMHEGAVIEVSNGGPALTISAGKGLERRYGIDGCQLKSAMQPRYGRWFGSLGIYDPAASLRLPFLPPKDCHGLSRTVVQEGQMHFDELSFAHAWIRSLQHAAGTTGKVVWTSDGLLVSWNEVAGRAQLNVDVWLICVDGQRPRRLAGADDHALSVRAPASGPALYDCAKVGKDVIAETRKQLEDDWNRYRQDDYRSSHFDH